jgi:predicted DNA-binding transcriptional regulator YafY
MLQTSVRVLRLLTLLQARRRWSGADLAEHLDVTERTLRRDVDRLRDLGYPVQSTSGTAGGYSLGQGAFLLPLMLDDDEGVAVAVALQVAPGSSLAGIEDASQRAMAKLERVLPERLRRRSRALRASLLRLRDAGPTVELAAVAALAAACSEHRGVGFGYRDHGGAETRRAVEPHRLVYMDRRWYLVAWDAVKRDWRTFRVDRIAPPISETAHFTPRDAPNGDLATYVTRAVSSAPYEHSVRLVLHASVGSMRSRISPSQGLLEAIDTRSCRLAFGTNSLVTTAVWLAGLDVDFEIEEPAELVNHVRRLAERFVRAARRPS